MLKEKKDESVTSNVSAVTGRTSKGQTFSKFQNVYRLNKQTGVLEKTEDVIDVSELIQSCKQTCLDACLERFLPQEQVVDEVADNLSRTLDVMDILREGIDTAERYRDEFQLDPSLSVYDVFEEVKKRSESLNSRLKTLKEEALKKEESKNEKNENV